MARRATRDRRSATASRSRSSPSERIADSHTWLARPDLVSFHARRHLDPVDLVEHQDLWQVGGADLGQHPVHLVDVFITRSDH